jgi:hypothetical protein
MYGLATAMWTLSDYVDVLYSNGSPDRIYCYHSLVLVQLCAVKCCLRSSASSLGKFYVLPLVLCLDLNVTTRLLEIFVQHRLFSAAKFSGSCFVRLAPSLFAYNPLSRSLQFCANYQTKFRLTIHENTASYAYHKSFTGAE